MGSHGITATESDSYSASLSQDTGESPYTHTRLIDADKLFTWILVLLRVKGNIHIKKILVFCPRYRIDILPHFIDFLNFFINN